MTATRSAAVRLSDLVLAERAVVPLEAPDLSSAVWILVERLTKAGVLVEPERLRGRVEEERPEDVVALADRGFLVHYRTDAVRDLVVGLGTATKPICRELGDGDEHQVQCARVIVLVMAPPPLATRYLQVVGSTARFLSKPARVEALLAAPNAEALAVLPALQEWTVPEQLLVRDLMTSRPRAVGPDTPIRQAALTMVRHGIGGLPVVDAEGRIVGMLGEKELLRHLQTNYLQPGAAQRPPAQGDRRTVRDVMTRQVLCVSPTQPVAEVSSIMSSKDVNSVPVVTGGLLVGFLTRGDIVRKLIGS